MMTRCPRHAPAPGPVRAAFTLVEILSGMAILILFFGGAYAVFSGGSNAAQKAQWLTGRTNDLRNAFDMLNKRLKSTSFPATLLNDGIFDAANSAGKTEYYVALKNLQAPDSKGTVSIKAEDITSETEIAHWYVCEPERIDASGKVTPGVMMFDRLICKPAVTGGKAVTTELWLNCEGYTFTSSANSKYAEGALTKTRVGAKDSKHRLVEDVATIRFESKASAMKLPIIIEIETRWTKDAKVSKGSQQSIIPNVGIKAL